MFILLCCFLTEDWMGFFGVFVLPQVPDQKSAILQTSNTQNFARQVGQGDFPPSQVSGCV